ncbi:MAG: C13 family peptidase [Xanthobacteraceae bacterium]
MWGVVKLAMRAAIWRRTSDPPLVGLRSLLAFAGLVAAVRAGLQLVEAGAWQAFNPYGLNAVIAWIALELAIAALFVRPAARTTALAAMFVLSVIADIVMTAIGIGAPVLAQAAGQPPTLVNNAVVAGAAYTLLFVWWVGAMTCIVGSLEQQSGWRLVGRIAGLWLALFAANVALPHTPLFVPPDFDPRNANWWETVYAAHRAEGKPRSQGAAQVTQVEKSQPRLLQEQFAQLTPSRKGETEIFTLAVAGWADQDVFVKELDGALEALGSVLPIKGRTVRLINRRDTVTTIPLANFPNYKAAVHAIGNVMDKDNDVFVLVMTSHGEQTGFALQLPGGVAELTPQQVAAALDGEGIKNRVVIVSACFSGIFVPPLANDNTIVITAADAKHTSFGCAPERDWTYFGDAFFHQSLHPGADFENAFDHARVLIHGWEMMDQATPSNPQGSFGPALVAKLMPLFATNPRP